MSRDDDSNDEDNTSIIEFSSSSRIEYVCCMPGRLIVWSVWVLIAAFIKCIQSICIVCPTRFVQSVYKLNEAWRRHPRSADFVSSFLFGVIYTWFLFSTLPRLISSRSDDSTNGKICASYHIFVTTLLGMLAIELAFTHRCWSPVVWPNCIRRRPRLARWLEPFDLLRITGLFFGAIYDYTDLSTGYYSYFECGSQASIVPFWSFCAFSEHISTPLCLMVVFIWGAVAQIPRSRRAPVVRNSHPLPPYQEVPGLIR